MLLFEDAVRDQHLGQHLLYRYVNYMSMISPFSPETIFWIICYSHWKKRNLAWSLVKMYHTAMGAPCMPTMCWCSKMVMCGRRFWLVLVSPQKKALVWSGKRCGSWSLTHGCPGANGFWQKKLLRLLSQKRAKRSEHHFCPRQMMDRCCCCDRKSASESFCGCHACIQRRCIVQKTIRLQKQRCDR